MNDNLKIFIPFAKKDSEQKKVQGYASTEALDSQGEIVEKEAIERALPNYLGEFDQETGKFRYGNLREMHQPSAVGKTVNARIDNKGLFITAKVVDPLAWEKVKEGVYAGFSIGGRVIQRVKNKIKELRLSEISLVDRPANPEAVFAMVKIDQAGKITDMQKEEVGAMEDKPVEIPHEEIMAAGHILDLARDLRCLLSMFQFEGKPIGELNIALNALKRLAAKLLTEEEKKKFDGILYSTDFADLDKLYLTKKESVKKEEKKGDISNFVNKNWSSGYFGDMKKALG